MDVKITLETWSGALPVPVACKQIETARLSADKQAELYRLLADPEILRLPEVSSVPTEVRDGVHFKMALQEPGKTKTLRVPDDKVSPALQRLFDFVMANGTPVAGGAGKR